MEPPSVSTNQLAGPIGFGGVVLSPLATRRLDPGSALLLEGARGNETRVMMLR